MNYQPRELKLTFVHAPLEVRHALQLLICWQPAIKLLHLFPQLGINLRLLSKLEEHVAKQTGSSVASCQQNVDKLVSDSLLICGLLDHFLNEKVPLALSTTGLLLLVEFLSETESLINELFNIFVADANGSLALFVLPESIQKSVSCSHRAVILSVVESLAKEGILIFSLALLAKHAERIRRVVEQEFSGSIDGETEEEFLKIHCRSVLRNVLEHELEVALKDLDVRNLIPCKVWSQHMSAVGPALAVCVENSMAQEGCHGLLTIAKTVVLELQTQDGLDVLWLARHNPWRVNDTVVVCFAQSFKSFCVLFQDDVIFAVVLEHFHDVQAQDGVFVILGSAWLAPICFDEAPAGKVEVNACVEKVRKEGASDDDEDRRLSHVGEVEQILQRMGGAKKRLAVVVSWTKVASICFIL